MSNPTNLQELADSLSASAEMAYGRMNEAKHDTTAMYAQGYRQALLDTRATVLAMIEDVNRRIANNNRIDGDRYEQGNLDGRIEAYEDVRGGESA